MAIETKTTVFILRYIKYKIDNEWITKVYSSLDECMTEYDFTVSDPFTQRVYWGTVTVENEYMRIEY